MQQHATKKRGASAQSLGNGHLKLLREQFVGSDDQSVCLVCACSEWELELDVCWLERKSFRLCNVAIC